VNSFLGYSSLVGKTDLQFSKSLFQPVEKLSLECHIPLGFSLDTAQQIFLLMSFAKPFSTG